MTYEIEKEFKATINFPYIEDDRDSIIKGINLIAKGYRNQVFCTIAIQDPINQGTVILTGVEERNVVSLADKIEDFLF